MTMTMQINGRGKFHPINDYADASRLMQKEQERIGYRSPSDRTIYPRTAAVFMDGKQVAYVSQNGRVWAGTEYVPGSEPICERVEL